ncbi:MAG: hypothetical protein BWZ04_02289 [Firmicutes bacterium ADurb.BinA205]|mgnify:CR=1 FL=1|nr:MAG: hypothetical protein BWZ04_02289 [Firmicutes bacterium ADurb.BinA205]
MADEKKGITVKIDAELHAEIRQFIEANGMTMAEFVSQALYNELHPKIQPMEVKNMGPMRTMAFQMPEDMFQRLKDYLHRHNMTQKEFVLGLVEAELNRDQALRNDQVKTEEEDLGENESEDEDMDDDLDEEESEDMDDDLEEDEFEDEDMADDLDEEESEDEDMDDDLDEEESEDEDMDDDLNEEESEDEDMEEDLDEEESEDMTEEETISMAM